VTTNSSISNEKTAIIGGDGFIGRAFARVWPDAIATSRRTGAEQFLDLCEPDIAPLRLRETGHRRALILAADPNIARCEADPERARAINLDGTLALVDQLLAEGIEIVFTSSDYVFDGREGDYTEDSPTEPGTVYGKLKLEAEQAIRERSGGEALILRLSKIYGLERGDGTLFDEMATLLAAGEPVRAAVDQVFCPMWIEDLVTATRVLLEKDVTGTVHVCGDEAMSRYEMACSLARSMGLGSEAITPIRLDDLGLSPIRPKQTSMRNRRLREVCASPFLSIEAAVEHLHQ